MITPRMSLVDAALAYAVRGWHVFPLHPESKRPACPDHRQADCDHTDPWCRLGHTGWEARATIDPDRIIRAWSSTPYGIGIACGPSRLVVVDLDTPKDDEPTPEPWAADGARCGGDVLALLAERADEVMPVTWTVRTVSGGTHLYFRAPRSHGGPRLGNTAGRLGWLIDTRAEGGYVVAPPTTIAGHTYEVVHDSRVAPLPDWLIAPLIASARAASAPAGERVIDRAHLELSPDRLSRYVAAAVDGEMTKVATALPGTRNHTLFCAAVALGQLVAGGQLHEHLAREALLQAAASHLAAGAYTASEADATIRSGFTTGARNPRTAA